jgi:hypothetical protein
MLVKVPLVKNGIEKLHEEISYFISQIGTAKRWSRNLFHSDFYNQVISQNPRLEELLRQFFKEFNKLPADRKAEIIQEFRSYNSVKEICNVITPVSSHWRDSTYPDFRKTTQTLFIFMYEETLAKVSYKNFSGESIKDHYNTYRQTYSISMCPFCGLEDYKDLHDELTARDAYDHYLDKARYPFAAVNPDNLFPMCHECNSGSKKTQDILHEDNSNTRRRAPYPPDDEFQVSIQISNGLLLNPSVSINLVGTNTPQVLEKFNTWLIVFQIRQRYEGRVKKKKKDWLSDIIVKLNPEIVDIEIDLPNKLRVSYEECSSSLMLRKQSEHTIKAAFLLYCKSNVVPVISFCKSEPSYTRYLADRSKALKS